MKTLDERARALRGVEGYFTALKWIHPRLTMKRMLQGLIFGPLAIAREWHCPDSKSLGEVPGFLWGVHHVPSGRLVHWFDTELAARRFLVLVADMDPDLLCYELGLLGNSGCIHSTMQIHQWAMSRLKAAIADAILERRG